MSHQVALLSAAAPITPDTPLPLEEALKIAFPRGGMTVSGLRREAARGRLVIEKIANRHFTTLRHIEEMRERCRDIPKEYASGLNQKREMQRVGSQGERHGSFETERRKSALDALREIAKGLSKPLRNTSAENTRCRGTGDVTPLKS
jgi:hypothetical protein